MIVYEIEDYFNVKYIFRNYFKILLAHKDYKAFFLCFIILLYK